MSNWRALEAEIVRIIRDYGFNLDQPSSTGDVLVINRGRRLNLTEFAKELDRAGVRMK